MRSDLKDDSYCAPLYGLELFNLCITVCSGEDIKAFLFWILVVVHSPRPLRWTTSQLVMVIIWRVRENIIRTERRQYSFVTGLPILIMVSALSTSQRAVML